MRETVNSVVPCYEDMAVLNYCTDPKFGVSKHAAALVNICVRYKLGKLRMKG